jgi:hypothetical protein
MIHFVVTLKGRLIGRFDVEGDRARIGRHADNEVQIDNRGVSRFHTQLLRDPSSGNWTIEDQGSHNGTFVNGARIKTKSLRDGDVVGVGQFSVSVSADGAPPPAAAEEVPAISVRPAPSPNLSEQLAPLKGYLEFLDRSGHIMINRDVTQIGSAPGLDIHIDGASKSVLIVRGYGGFQIVNCRPGDVEVLLNGALLDDRAWLESGARVQLGADEFTFYAGLPSEDMGTMQIEVPRLLRGNKDAPGPAPDNS